MRCSWISGTVKVEAETKNSECWITAAVQGKTKKEDELCRKLQERDNMTGRSDYIYYRVINVR
jgi:hypothetical protein